MRKAGLTGTAVLLAAFGLFGAAPTAAQEAAPFEVVVTGQEGDALWVRSALEVRVDDLVFDYQDVAGPPEGTPDGLASAQAERYRLYGPGQAH